MKNKQLQTKQQSIFKSSPEKLSLDELSKISAGILFGHEIGHLQSARHDP